MVINNEEALFNEQLCARVHRLRNERGMTAQEMATVLGVPADRYRKYEYRSPLPHYLLEKFALIVGRDVEFLLTGRTNRRITHLAEMAPSAESRRKRA
jgi:transcriptional regulator with XRE-family HTH domain